MSLPADIFLKSSEISKSPDPTEPAAAMPADSSASGWKQQLANATTSVADLLERLKLGHDIEIADLQSDFKCLVTDAYLSKIQPGDINDPLLQQVLPLKQETNSRTQYHGVTDPVGDLKAMVSPGLLHKYHGRALLISTAACAIHCRYCFRRCYPYQESSYSNKVVNQTLDYLNKHPEIGEIILSGGDPLTLGNRKLGAIITALENIRHIHTLRIHTRLPVVLPDRIDSGLLQLFLASRFQIVVVIHVNHANELADAEYTKLHLLHKAGITLLNQSVLLNGINDNADTLIALSNRLFECKTLPYYLHLLDPVKGAMQFNVSKKNALHLKSQLENQLPGYLVPRLVQEIAENKSKTAIYNI